MYELKDSEGIGAGQDEHERWESGWYRPARCGGKPTGASGMFSARNVDGVHVAGFGARVLSLDQWANVPETEDGQVARLVVNAVRAMSVRGLERAAMRETWGSSAMRDFLNAQFLRSVEEGKLVQCFTMTGEAAWATFHTNLLSDDEFPLFAVFFREFDQAAAARTDKWELCGFVDDIALRDPSQPWNQIEPILHIPPRATFVDDPSDHLWLADAEEEVVLEIDTRFWASLENQANVFPENINTAAARQRSGSAAVPRAARMVLYGYHVPALRYARLEGQRAPGKLQMLLPLNLDANSMQTHGAIVVDIIKSRRGGRMYRAVGIISLEDAVLTSRIVGPITAEWLQTDTIKFDPVVVENEPMSPPPGPIDVSPVSVIEHAKTSDEEKPAYAAIANKPATEHKIRVLTKSGSQTMLRVDDLFKPVPQATRLAMENPKVNLKMLPFEFMQAVTRKLNIDEKILRLNDAPTDAEFRVIQSISVEASVWLRNIMASYGLVDRVYVGVSRRVRCFFAVVSFERWFDLPTRDAMVRGESIVVKEFKCRDRVYMRISLEDKNELKL